ncbi:DUF3325 domain-containing protein [Aquabacterium sp.]|uniref:DUF3325 domain-containing protein n=1 Tax=Aquabacterium sp. TaxID=1872578 RepID=UPI002C2497BC|nr:DUF3325 domain-containing protein [Aquabacterium sp.]HSW04719.1 DUF3325 domain-containing protein [Aquabacterium sp.]
MSESALTLIAALGSYLGFALLALSQERHWSTVSKTSVAQRVRRIGPAGTGLLAQPAALTLTIVAHGAGFGVLLWAVMISAAALAVAFTLSWRPQWLQPIARLLRISPTSGR